MDHFTDTQKIGHSPLRYGFSVEIVAYCVCPHIPPRPMFDEIHATRVFFASAPENRLDDLSRKPLVRGLCCRN
ncbi:hypothetical protein E2979_21045 [Paracoccus yeei]